MRLITGDVDLRVRLYISNSRCFCCLQLNVVSLLIDSLGNILKINMGSHLIHIKVRCTYRTRDVLITAIPGQVPSQQKRQIKGKLQVQVNSDISKNNVLFSISA